MSPDGQPPKLTVIVPAYNESQNVRAVFDKSVRVLTQSGLDGQYELILVDDGSTDDTGAIMDELQRQRPWAKALHHAENRGLGAAVRTGIAASRGDYVSFIPADGEVGVDQVVKFLGEVGDADLLVSTRQCSEETIRTEVRPWHREALTWGHSQLSRLALGFNPKGMEGIFLARGDLLRALRLKSQTGTLCLEIVLRFRRQHCRFARSVMEYCPRLSGHSKVTNLRSVTRSLWDMLKLRCAR